MLIKQDGASRENREASLIANQAAGSLHLHGERQGSSAQSLAALNIGSTPSSSRVLSPAWTALAA
jgi:hypothetical protein